MYDVSLIFLSLISKYFAHGKFSIKILRWIWFNWKGKPKSNAEAHMQNTHMGMYKNARGKIMSGMYAIRNFHFLLSFSAEF